MNNYGDDEPSLEFDIDAILESNPNPLDQQQHDHHHRQASPQRAPPSAPPQPPQVTYPDLIMADLLDDNYTISTLGRDQSLMTRDDPPIAMFRPSFDPDRFADEEAPSLPKYSYKNTLRNNKSEEATRRLSPSGAGGGDNPSLGSGSASNRTNVSYRDLYMVVIVMAILLLAIITGLAIWLIALRTSATLAEGSSISSEKETIWDRPTLSPTRIPTRFDDVLTKTPTVPTIAPTRVTITAAPIRDTPRPTTAPAPLEPTSQPKTPAPSKATPAPTTRPTLSPTPVPTVKPTPLPTPLPTPVSIAVQNARTKFLQVLESYSSSAVSSTLARVESPQYHALDWLIHDPNFEQYSNARLIQRWVLASFALGLEDTDWKDDKTAIARSYSPLNLPQALDTWVKYTDECTWFYSSVDNAQLCNEEGLYHRIDLRSQNLAGTIPTEIGLLSNHLGMYHFARAVTDSHFNPTDGFFYICLTLQHSSTFTTMKSWAHCRRNLHC